MEQKLTSIKNRKPCCAISFPFWYCKNPKRKDKRCTSPSGYHFPLLWSSCTPDKDTCHFFKLPSWGAPEVKSLLRCHLRPLTGFRPKERKKEALPCLHFFKTPRFCWQKRRSLSVNHNFHNQVQSITGVEIPYPELPIHLIPSHPPQTLLV